jgi:drug/metabolite transporter (DMT)-like permease
MDGILIAAALSSAVLHAGWNAAVKAAPRPFEAMSAQMITSALIVLPVLAWTGLPAPASWGWIAASTALNMVVVTALLKTYDLAGFGLGYPVVRALSVLLIAPLALAVSGEQLSASGWTGVGLIAAALGVLGFANHRDGAVSTAALGWIALAGVTTAAYVYCDARGVRASGSALAYGATVTITNAIAMMLRNRHFGSPLQLLRDNAAIGIPTSIAAVVSYLAILWVFGLAPIAPAAALRDTSAVFAILIAVFWLKEPFTHARLAAVALTATAIPLLRLA